MNGVANLALAGQSQIGDIAFIDLKAQQRRIRDRIEQRFKTILDHGRYIGGPEITEFEEKLCERTGAKAAVSCASGTAALIMPLLSSGVETTDAVFLPAFTYNATANAVIIAGATPVFVDIDPATFNMDVEDLKRRIEIVKAEGRLRPRGIVPVDLFGSPADYIAINDIAAKEDMFVLADAAQSFGGELHGKWAGNLAPVTATSFFPGKALGAYGDAGAILCDDKDAAEVWESIRWHGTDSARKNSVRVGFNGRMDSMQAAVLLEKLAIFDDELAARRRIAETYNEHLSKIAQPQAHLEGAQSGFGYYALRTGRRNEVVAKLQEMGVPTAIYYSTPLHHMPAFEAYAPAEAGSHGSNAGLPATEQLCKEIFSLPMHPYLTPVQVEFICEAVEVCLAE